MTSAARTTFAAFLILFASTGNAQEPVLLRAELFTHTNDDNKDHDTGIHLTVKTQDGTSELAECHNADSSGQDATEYNDGSDHIVRLTVVSNPPKSVCKKFKVHMWQQTNGHDTWKFNAKVTLFFSDGTNIVANDDGVTLENDGATTDFSSP